MTSTSNEFDILTELDPDEAKPCGLLVLKQGAETPQPCGKEAAYKVTLIKPCAHIADVYRCEECWVRTVAQIQSMTWTCRDSVEGGNCGTSYYVATAVVSVERIR